MPVAVSGVPHRPGPCHHTARASRPRPAPQPPDHCGSSRDGGRRRLGLGLNRPLPLYSPGAGAGSAESASSAQQNRRCNCAQDFVPQSGLCPVSAQVPSSLQALAASEPLHLSSTSLPTPRQSIFTISPVGVISALFHAIDSSIPKYCHRDTVWSWPGQSSDTAVDI